MFSDHRGRQPAIYLKHLSKKYPIYDRPSQKLWELLTLRKKEFHREFWALRDIHLEVDPGITLGIVGRNGSGKSTLLQIVAGIMAQTRGDCFVNGKVSALLELGTGFNPEFTGRENVFMNGAIMGLTYRELERRLPQILEFAEIGRFVDQPVKTYSSGMFMRLAFSLAIHVDPDILLVDETLAVGDLVFQHRCASRIRQLREGGKTILFVTHDLQAVTAICDRAILLEGGEKLEDGSPEEVVQRYRSLIFEREGNVKGRGDRRPPGQKDQTLPVVRSIPHVQNRYGNRGAEIVGILLCSPDGTTLSELQSGEQVRLLISVRFHQDIKDPIIGFTVRDRLGVDITSSNTSYEGLSLPFGKSGDIFTVGFQISVPQVRPGSYSISPAISQGNIWEHAIEDWIDNAYIVDIIDTGLIYGMMRWPVEVSFNVQSPSKS